MEIFIAHQPLLRFLAMINEALGSREPTEQMQAGALYTFWMHAAMVFASSLVVTFLFWYVLAFQCIPEHQQRLQKLLRTSRAQPSGRPRLLGKRCTTRYPRGYPL